MAGAECPEKENVPKFHIKPVTSYGDGIIGQEGSRLSDEGYCNCFVVFILCVAERPI